ncbi:MAG: CRISPR-associated endonuclease/helicase Cas3, partial [Phenylobacterium sp.]
AKNPIDGIRQDISNVCKQRAVEAQGIYSLTVPTGGGKTYASLRYAVHHAKQHQLDRIIYIIPYTSIIDQNAAAIRKVLEHQGDETPWVLEQHSNLEPEKQTWRSKLVSENWDSPVVLTTMVQFLETLFSGGTRGVRKLHQLANSVIVFDEIQTLPINCTHLFCNSINFLTAHCKTTAVLCTATQPLLNQLKQPDKGQLHLRADNELMPNVRQLFDDLKRVDIVDKTTDGGWSLEDIGRFAVNELMMKDSCLVIVNTKNWAQALYQNCVETAGVDEKWVFHLSTSQCPAHRMQLLEDIRDRLDNGLPILCISTQLIEAGVDVDFNSVIRFRAGMDSIAQAAGRCNRNGNGATAEVYVINPDVEKIDVLVDITEGITQTKRIFNQFKDTDLLAPEVMEQYFDYYFFNRADDMSYTLTSKQAERDDNLLNLLSLNPLHPTTATPLPLKQSFMTAGKAFKAIDAPTQSILVQYGEGADLVAQLCAVSKQFDAQEYYDLLKQLQKYSVNVFPNVWRKLQEQAAVIEIGEGEGVYYLKENHYSDAFGLSTEAVGSMSFQCC